METSRERLSRAVFAGVLLGVGTYMALLSAIAPVVSDDIWMPTGMDGKGLQDLTDIIRSCTDIYLRTNLRLGHAVYWWVLFFGRWLFVVLNPVVFLTLGYVVFILASGRKPEPENLRDVTLLLFIYLLIGGAGPAITEVSFWGNGAVQYLWGCAAVFGFLVPFRIFLDGRVVLRDTRENAVLMFLAGFLVAHTSETIVPGAIMLIALGWLFSYRTAARRPLWLLAGSAGLCIGFLVFALAPGNFRRAATTVPKSLWNMGLFERLFEVTPQLFRKFIVYSGRRVVQVLEITAVAGIGVLVIDFLRSRAMEPSVLRDRRLILALAFLATAAATIFSFFVVPAKMSSRVYFGAGMMIIVSIIIIVHVLFYERYRRLAKYFVGAVGFLCVVEMAAIAKEYVDIRPQYLRRLEMIEQAGEAGLSSVRLPMYRRQRNRHIWLRDITPDPSSPENRVIAERYGFDEVIGYEPEARRRSR